MESQLVSADSQFMLRIADMNKVSIPAEAMRVATEIDEMGGDLIRATAIARKMALYASEFEKAAKKKLETEVVQYGKAGVSRVGVRLKIGESVSYDYSGDPVWVRLNQAVIAAEKARDAWQKTLKTIGNPQGRPTIDPATGEVYTAYAPIRKASDTIKAEIL